MACLRVAGRCWPLSMLSIAPSASSLPYFPTTQPVTDFFYLMADTKGLTWGNEKGPGFMDPVHR